jgi:hypothetical protein
MWRILPLFVYKNLVCNLTAGDVAANLTCVLLVKTTLKRKRFQDAEHIKKNVMTELNAAALEASADCFP